MILLFCQQSEKNDQYLNICSHLIYFSQWIYNILLAIFHANSYHCHFLSPSEKVNFFSASFRQKQTKVLPLKVHQSASDTTQICSQLCNWERSLSWMIIIQRQKEVKVSLTMCPSSFAGETQMYTHRERMWSTHNLKRHSEI